MSIEALCGGCDSDGLLALAAGLLGRQALRDSSNGDGPGADDNGAAPCIMTQIIQQAHFKPPGRPAVSRGTKTPFFAAYTPATCGPQWDGLVRNVSIAIDAEVDENGPLRSFPRRIRRVISAARRGSITARWTERTQCPLLQPGTPSDWTVHHTRQRAQPLYVAVAALAHLRRCHSRFIRTRQGAVSMAGSASATHRQRNSMLRPSSSGQHV